jgi:hypothetical protein
VSGRSQTDADDALRRAWHGFCDELKQSGDELFHEKVSGSRDERAEAFRYLAQSVALGFLFHVENQMPRHPYLLQYFTPDRKQAGDNADSLILGAFIDGSETYRISGERGSATWFAVTALRPTRDGEPRHPMGAPYNLVLDARPLLLPDLEVADDGTVEIILGPDEHDGNWIRTTPETAHVRIRQFFGDWTNERPARLQIERVGEPAAPPPLLTPETWVEHLQDVTSFVRASATFWPELVTADATNVMTPRPNIGMGPGESWSGKVDANPGGVNASCHWRLAQGEALVVEWTPTPAYFWIVELDNVWAATMDYRWRLSNLNATQAVYEDDGSVRMVLSHEDPGVPNWLDLSGWSEGMVNMRMLLCTEVPEFRSRVAPVGELSASLPSDAKRIDGDGRREQLRRRREGVLARFGM